MLVQVLRRWKSKAQETWWFWLAWPFIQDRIIPPINRWVDSTGAPPMLVTARDTTQWLSSSPIGPLGLLVLIVLLALLVSAYRDARRARHARQERRAESTPDDPKTKITPVAPTSASEFTPPDAPVIQGQFEFYPGRIKLPEHRHLRLLLESVKDEVLISWNTGAHVGRAQLLKLPVRKKILLPHPIHIAPLLAAAEGISTNVVAEQIEELTRVARQTARDEHLDVEVRWLNRVPRNTVILGDPQREHGWAFIELCQPGVDEDLRPILRFTKAAFPALYGGLRTAFDRQWTDQSVDTLWLPTIDPGSSNILFNLGAREPTSIQAVRLTVTAPTGFTATKEDTSPLVLDREGTRKWFAWPQHFGHDAQSQVPTNGRYKARWEVNTGDTWREAITETYDVRIGS